MFKGPAQAGDASTDDATVGTAFAQALEPALDATVAQAVEPADAAAHAATDRSALR